MSDQLQRIRRGHEALARSGVPAHEFAERMHAYQRASGVPISALLPPLTSIEDWERACRRSQELADDRRQPSPHPWPERGQRLATFALAAVLIVVAFYAVWWTWLALS